MLVGMSYLDLATFDRRLPAFRGYYIIVFIDCSSTCLVSFSGDSISSTGDPNIARDCDIESFVVSVIELHPVTCLSGFSDWAVSDG